MRKDVAKALKVKAEETAKKYSNKNRTNNFNGESFKVDDIIPISAQGAMVIFSKSTGKKALAHFIHIDHPKKPFWQYYIMGSQHFINLNMLEKKYAEIERHNFKLNFDHIPKEQDETNLPKLQ
tara:strand:+ start:345 stop:713 length:369 start_codon:yes stop_codon:yes gene_type:complete